MDPYLLCSATPSPIFVLPYSWRTRREVIIWRRAAVFAMRCVTIDAGMFLVNILSGHLPLSRMELVLLSPSPAFLLRRQRPIPSHRMQPLSTTCTALYLDCACNL